MAQVDPATAMTYVPGNQTAPTAIPGSAQGTAATVVAASGEAATVIGHQDGATAAGAAAINPLDALVGRTLGGCIVGKLLGRGGMGAVYKAQQQSLSRAVALKVMLPGRDADPQFASRFQREARVVAALNHPHVVQVYDTGRSDDGMLYLIMEFVDGRSLAEVIRDQGALPIPLALAVIRQAAEGLAGAHAKGLVHRDIKPDNLMIDADARVKVMDFGLARPTEGSGDSSLTMSGMILGTPNYISPEAARGEPADIRADLYSLGVTLWQCIAGKLPFTGPTPVQVLVQHIEAATPDLANAVPKCPRPVADLCQRLLAKRAADRFADPSELVREIHRLEQRLCGGTVHLRWDQRRLVADAQLDTAADSPASGHGAATAVTVVVILLLIGVVVGVGWYFMQEKSGSDLATSTVVAGHVSEPGEPLLPAEPASLSSTGSAAPANTNADAPTIATEKAPEITPRPTVPQNIAATTAPMMAPPAINPPRASAPIAAPIIPEVPSLPVAAPTLPAEAPPVASLPETPTSPSGPAVPLSAPSPSAMPPALPPEAPPRAAVPEPAAVESAHASAPALIPIATLPPPAPARPASLSVSSLPAGATVEIDGENKGTTPCLITNLTAGEHRIRVHGNGLDERTVIVLAGGRVTRIGTPLPEPARLELFGLPAGARVTADNRPYFAGIAVATGTITVQVINGETARAFTVDTVAGRNVFRYAP